MRFTASLRGTDPCPICYTRRMSGLIWLLLGGSILTAGDILFKFWIEKPKEWLYAAGLAVYLVGLVFLVQSFKTHNIAIARRSLSS